MEVSLGRLENGMRSKSQTSLDQLLAELPKPVRKLLVLGKGTGCWRFWTGRMLESLLFRYLFV
jgi:hypothetical protein